ncbi:MAG: hypothetical protein RL701_4990 [Pseudomonadota bacterium]
MIPHAVEIFVALEPVGMRLGFDRLSGLVQERMQRSPLRRVLQLRALAPALAPAQLAAVRSVCAATGPAPLAVEYM